MGLTGFPNDSEIRDMFGLTDEDSAKLDQQRQAAEQRRTGKPGVLSRAVGPGLDMARVATRGQFTGEAVEQANQNGDEDTVEETTTRVFRKRRPITEDERAERDAGFSL